MPPGNYRLSVIASSFKTVTHESVQINVGQDARLDFKLEIGAVNESISISGDGPLLERETSAVGQVIENKTIVTLPLNGQLFTTCHAHARRDAEPGIARVRWV